MCNRLYRRIFKPYKQTRARKQMDAGMAILLIGITLAGLGLARALFGISLFR